MATSASATADFRVDSKRRRGANMAREWHRKEQIELRCALFVALPWYNFKRQSFHRKTPHTSTAPSTQTTRTNNSRRRQQHRNQGSSV